MNRLLVTNVNHAIGTRLEAASKLPREVHLGIVTYASAGDSLLISNELLGVKFHAVRSYRTCSIVVIFEGLQDTDQKNIRRQVAPMFMIRLIKMK